MQDNIALIAVLEAKFGSHGADNPSKRQLLCVVRYSESIFANVIVVLFLNQQKNIHFSEISLIKLYI